MRRFSHDPFPVTVEVVDADTNEQTSTVQIRCGCTVELWKDYGA